MHAVFGARTAAAAAKYSMTIGSIEAFDNARVRKGTRYDSLWRGISTLPRGSTSLGIGSIRAGGNSKVWNGDIVIAFMMTFGVP